MENDRAGNFFIRKRKILNGYYISETFLGARGEAGNRWIRAVL